MKFVKVSSNDVASCQAIVDLEAELFGDGGLNIWAIQPLSEYQMIYQFLGPHTCAYAILLTKLIDPETVYLFSFGVDTKMHGQGLGKLFLNDLLVELKTLGFSKLELTVSKDNKVAQHLYKSKMEVLSTTYIKSCYGDGEDREKLIFKI